MGRKVLTPWEEIKRGGKERERNGRKRNNRKLSGEEREDEERK